MFLFHSPYDVTWGSQIRMVFDRLNGDFMKSVLEDVNFLLNNRPDLKIIVYNGQLDLIVNVLGTSKWVEKGLHWPGEAEFRVAAKRSLKRKIKTEEGEEIDELLGFYKTAGNFRFYWIMNSGHMIPRDAPEAGLEMLKHILN